MEQGQRNGKTPRQTRRPFHSAWSSEGDKGSERLYGGGNVESCVLFGRRAKNASEPPLRGISAYFSFGVEYGFSAPVFALSPQGE